MGAILKMRFLRNLYEPTCRITDSASMTNTPPIKGKDTVLERKIAVKKLDPVVDRESLSNRHERVGGDAHWGFSLRSLQDRVAPNDRASRRCAARARVSAFGDADAAQPRPDRDRPAAGARRRPGKPRDQGEAG